MQECWLGGEELPVWEDCSWKRFGEPIQSDAVKDLVKSRVCVRPDLKLLSNPVRGQRSSPHRGQTHQASNASGLEDKQSPIVAGLVPCILPYAFPNVLKSLALCNPLFSTSLKPFIGSSRLGIGAPIQKLTVAGQPATIH